MRKISNRNDQNPWRAIGLVSAMGIDLAICVLLGVWAGRWLDDKMNSTPIFLLICIVLGLIVGIISIIHLIKPFIEDDKHG